MKISPKHGKIIVTGYDPTMLKFPIHLAVNTNQVIGTVGTNNMSIPHLHQEDTNGTNTKRT